MAEQIIEFEAMEQAVSLFGSFDENVKLIENEYDVSIISRGSELKVMGDVENVDKAARALRSMLAMINKGESLTEQNVRYVLTLVNEGNEDKIASMSSGSICISSKGRPIKPKTLGQKRYCDAILNNTITFGGLVCRARVSRLVLLYVALAACNAAVAVIRQLPHQRRDPPDQRRHRQRTHHKRDDLLPFSPFSPFLAHPSASFRAILR